MKIATRLMIMAILPGGLLFITGGFFIFSGRYDRGDMEMAQILDEIVNICSELVLIADVSNMENEERDHRQWNQRQTKLGDILTRASAVFLNDEERPVFESIIQSRKISMQLYDAHEACEESMKQNRNGSFALQQSYLAQMRSMLIIELQSMIFRADRLKHMEHEEIILSSNLQIKISVFLLIILSMGIPGLSFLIISGIKRSMKRLADGMDLVSSGCLDHRIGLTENDELGALSRAFDRMTERLQILTVSRDDLLHEIEERKKAEEELGKFTAIIEATTDFVGIADARGHVKYVNPAGRKMIGFGEDEDISKTVIPDYFTEQSKKYILSDIIPRCIEQGATSFESAFLSRPGRLIHFSGVSLSHKSDDGKVRFLSLVARDITEQKNMEEALKSEKNLSDSIIDSMPGVLYIFDVNGKFLRWNKNLELITGYSTEELSGLQPLDLFAGKDRYNIEQKITDVFEYGSASAEAKLVAKDGTTTPFLFTGRLVKIGVLNYLAGLGLDITERKQAEEKLRRFTAIIEATTDFVGIANTDGYTTYINPAGRRMLGIGDEEDISGFMMITDYNGVLSKKRVRKGIIPTIMEQGSVSFEDAFMSRSGRIIPFSGVALSHKSREGKVEFVSLIARDISERERMREALVAEIKLSDSIIDSMPGIFYLFHADGTMMRWNHNSELISGYSSDEIAAMHPLDFFDDICKTAVTEKIMEALEKGEASLEADVVTKDGRRIPFFLTGKRIIIGDSKYVTGVGIDITLRRKAEKELRRFTDIIELTSDFVGIADANGNVLYANPAGRRILELGPDEDITGTVISDYFTEETGLFIKSVAVPSSIENRTYEYESEFLSGSGRLVPFSGVSLCNRASDGSIEFLSLIARDITERKNNEKKMLWLMEELQRSNQELEQLAYIASHDLREPLRKIVSFIDLFASKYGDSIDERASLYISYIVDGATRMSNLINDLLFYSRVMTDEKEFETVDCNALIETVLDDMMLSIRENKAQIFHDALPQIKGHKIQLGQLFQNLIANAIKYHRPEEPAIIHVSAALDGEAYWIFSFRDNGIGIEPEYLERIFVLFQRLHSRSEYSGTGIGLAICKKIVERHGGRIWVESEYGKGSTFYFSLPAPEDNK